MLDREERASFVVPSSPSPPPRIHLGLALLVALFAAVAGLMLAVADYSPGVTAWLVVTTGTGVVAAVGLIAAGRTARRRYREEMERAVDVTPIGLRTADRSSEAV